MTGQQSTEQASHSDLPPRGGTSPIYRFELGEWQGTIVSDGTIPLRNPEQNFIGLTRAEIDEQLAENFQRASNAVLEQNVLILKTGGRLVLFDTGAGSLNFFGPTTGRLLTAMRQAGIDPQDIDAVVMSHAHIDHCGGCMADDGSRLFPNAQYYISQADYDFWTDTGNATKGLEVFFEAARKNLVPNRDRMVFVEDGQEFLPGIHAIAAPGHTMGHMIFVLNSGGRSLVYVGDLAHHPVLLLKKPLTEFAYDSEPKQSAQTRVRMLGMLAANRIPILAYHFPWPGIGHVARRGDGFRYIQVAIKGSL